MKDRSDELSTADLAGQSAGSGAADERAVRDEPADRTGEPRDGLPGDRDPDAGYAESRDAYAVDRAHADDHPYAGEGGAADDRAAYADDRVGGIGSRDPSGPTPADDPADRTGVVADRTGYGDDDAGYADDTAVTTDRAGYANNTAVPTDRPGYADDAAMSPERGGLAGVEPTMTTGRSGHPDSVVDDRAGYGGGTGMTGQQSGYGGMVGNGVAGQKTEPLLGSADSEQFRARWTDVQTGFVDEPRRAVEQADGLTAELMQHLAKSFADERLRLERQWDSGEDIPTDDLRTAFQRYRSFFERLLST